MELKPLIEGLGIRHVAGPRNVRVCDLTEDSRTVVPGSLFVAREGERSDGRRFIGEAIRSGAVAILTDRPPDEPAPEHAALLVARDVPLAMARIGERFFGNPSSSLELIGVTGTNGKTTTAHLIHQLLNGLGIRCGLIGTVLIDDGVELARAAMTTPPAFEVSRSLAMMVEAGCRAAVLEASSHALAQGRVSGLAFDVGVFTNLSGDHLDYHGSMEEYARAKATLFSLLDGRGIAVVNADCPWSGRMVQGTRARVLRCSCAGEETAGMDARAAVRSVSLGGMRMEMALAGFAPVEAALPLTGVHNASNALLATVASLEAFRLATGGEAPEPDRVGAQLARVRPPAGRLEACASAEDDLRVYVDFAHTDDALEKVLGALREAMRRDGAGGRARLWVVFGCGGNKDRTKRPRMGAVAARLADHVVVTSDNPRREEPGAIIGEILGGMTPERRRDAVVHVDRRCAIRHAILGASPGDVVLVAGKGHETEQELSDGCGGTRSVRFDDREEVGMALRERRARGAGAGETREVRA